VGFVVFGLAFSYLASRSGGGYYHQNFLDIFLDTGILSGLVFGIPMGLILGFMLKTIAVVFTIDSEAAFRNRLNNVLPGMGYRIKQDNASEIWLDVKSRKLMDSTCLIQIAGNQITITGPSFVVNKLKKKVGN
jgi:hypothetical protein